MNLSCEQLEMPLVLRLMHLQLHAGEMRLEVARGADDQPALVILLVLIANAAAAIVVVGVGGRRRGGGECGVSSYEL